MNAMMWLVAAIVTAVVWAVASRRGKHETEIILGGGTDDQKSARMAERAREYEAKYGNREGNYSA